MAQTEFVFRGDNGTHVRPVGEIGPLRFGMIERKGKQNRRMNLFFAEESPA